MPYARSVRPPAACSPTTTPRSSTTRAGTTSRRGPRAGEPPRATGRWNFPSRLDDVAALEAALSADPEDATAAALLGHWCYAHDRPDDAVRHWRRSAELDPGDPVVWRNLAVAAFNHEQRSGGGRQPRTNEPLPSSPATPSWSSSATNCSSASERPPRTASNAWSNVPS